MSTVDLMNDAKVTCWPKNSIDSTDNVASGHVVILPKPAVKRIVSIVPHHEIFPLRYVIRSKRPLCHNSMQIWFIQNRTVNVDMPCLNGDRFPRHADDSL